MRKVFSIRRRQALFCGAALLAGRSVRAENGIIDVLGRRIALRAPAERIVLGFNYEEYTAIAGPAG